MDRAHKRPITTRCGTRRTGSTDERKSKRKMDHYGKSLESRLSKQPIPHKDGWNK